LKNLPGTAQFLSTQINSQTDTSKKACWTRKPHPVHTDSKYTVSDKLTNLLN
jgi:hypothetical protein